MKSWQEMQVQLLLSAENETDLFEKLSGAVKELGFEYCAYGMRIPLPISSPQVIMFNNYSLDWQQRYTQENYLAIDPTVAHGTRTMMPLVWSNNEIASCHQFWEDAFDHGLRFGWAQSSHNASGVGGMLILSRSHDKLTQEELSENSLKMSWLTQIAHEGMIRALLPKVMPDAIMLTQREIEVLRWTAEGKTSADVGDIINITERTVNFHINNSMVKLGVVNKTAAVIKAALLRLL